MARWSLSASSWRRTSSRIRSTRVRSVASIACWPSRAAAPLLDLGRRGFVGLFLLGEFFHLQGLFFVELVHLHGLLFQVAQVALQLLVAVVHLQGPRLQLLLPLLQLALDAIEPDEVGLVLLLARAPGAARSSTTFCSRSSHSRTRAASWPCNSTCRVAIFRCSSSSSRALTPELLRGASFSARPSSSSFRAASAWAANSSISRLHPGGASRPDRWPSVFGGGGRGGCGSARTSCSRIWPICRRMERASSCCLAASPHSCRSRSTSSSLTSRACSRRSRSAAAAASSLSFCRRLPLLASAASVWRRHSASNSARSRCHSSCVLFQRLGSRLQFRLAHRDLRLPFAGNGRGFAAGRRRGDGRDRCGDFDGPHRDAVAVTQVGGAGRPAVDGDRLDRGQLAEAGAAGMARRSRQTTGATLPPGSRRSQPGTPPMRKPPSPTS